MMTLKILVILSLFFEAAAFETSADDVSLDSQNGVYTLRGNAMAKDEYNRVFKADTIIIYKDKRSSKPKKVKAIGNVSYQDKETVITSDLCNCDMVNVIFSSNVILKSVKLGTIVADVAKYDIKTKRVDLSSEKKVKLLLNEDLGSKINKKLG